MFFAANFETAQANEVRRVRPNGVRTSRRPYFGPRPSPVSGDHAAAVFVPVEDEALREPQAFMVELGEGNPLPVHFHFVDQFQVVLAGGANWERWSVMYLSTNEAALDLQAGPEGAQILVLQYPVPSP